MRADPHRYFFTCDVATRLRCFRFAVLPVLCMVWFIMFAAVCFFLFFLVCRCFDCIDQRMIQYQPIILRGLKQTTSAHNLSGLRNPDHRLQSRSPIAAIMNPAADFTCGWEVGQTFALGRTCNGGHVRRRT